MLYCILLYGWNLLAKAIIKVLINKVLINNK